MRTRESRCVSRRSRAATAIELKKQKPIARAISARLHANGRFGVMSPRRVLEDERIEIDRDAHQPSVKLSRLSSGRAGTDAHRASAKAQALLERLEGGRGGQRQLVPPAKTAN